MNRDERRAAKPQGKAAAGHRAPAEIPETFAAAFSHHQAGRLAEAERLYRQVCAIDPSHVESLHFLGVLAAQAGRNDTAVDMMRRALALKPDYADAHFNLANVLARQKLPAEAAASYRAVLSLRSNFAEALYGLGTVCLEQGQYAEAADSLERALQLRPMYPEAHYNLGFLLTQQCRLEEAVGHYERALALRPNFVEAHNALGAALLAQGEPAEAISCFEHALTLKPDFAKAHCNLGKAYEQQGRLDQAMARFARALAIAPGLAEAHHNMGNLLARQGRLDEALASFERALAGKPDFAEALSSRGVVLRDLKRPAEALADFEAALAIRPDLADAHCNRGAALRDLRRPGEALAALDGALALAPDHADAHYNRGIAQLDLGRPADALASFDAALALRPEHADAQYNRAAALRDLKRLAEAAAGFERALALKPDHRYAFGAMADAALAICDWARTASLAGVLEERVARRGSIISPFTLLGYGSSPALQLEAARSSIAGKVASPTPPPRHGGSLHQRDRLRIAYLSADFRQHAVASLLAGLIERHDRARFEIFGISFGPDDQSEMRGRLAAAFDGFHDVRPQNDQEAASLLDALGIDIAVDLMGHTQGARPGILGNRPAPIQANYLGYPGTMGADFIDYVIADRTVLPFDRQPYYTEKIVHLPGCYQVNDSKRKMAATAPSRREAGLPEQGFVFCCFNNNYKITAPVFDVWMRLLRAVEGSVLWLLHDNDNAQENLCREAAARGIAPARLVFAGRVDLAEHLARHRLADLFLDTLPYNAHTTGSDALWVGLPLLTCSGDGFAGRVAASLLHAAGLSQLVTHDLGEYESLSLRLAGDRSLLGALRHRLAENRSTCALFDTDRSRRHIEAAYCTMWELHRRGEGPRSFAVEP
jgi:predicted O-linked N-acetylglucosamine transferase (SPINDLY family)